MTQPDKPSTGWVPTEAEIRLTDTCRNVRRRILALPAALAGRLLDTKTIEEVRWILEDELRQASKPLADVSDPFPGYDRRTWSEIWATRPPLSREILRLLSAEMAGSLTFCRLLERLPSKPSGEDLVAVLEGLVASRLVLKLGHQLGRAGFGITEAGLQSLAKLDADATMRAVVGTTIRLDRGGALIDESPETLERLRAARAAPVRSAPAERDVFDAFQQEVIDRHLDRDDLASLLRARFGEAVKALEPLPCEPPRAFVQCPACSGLGRARILGADERRCPGCARVYRVPTAPLCEFCGSTRDCDAASNERGKEPQR